MSDAPATPVSDATPAPNRWEQRIGEFAKLVGKDPSTISQALVILVGDPGDEALVILGDPSAVTDEDLRKALVDTDPPKIPLGVLRKHLAVLRGPQVTTPVEVGTAPSAAVMIGNLPELPSDDSFVNMLKVGGVLKPGSGEVIAAAKSAIAAAIGLYDLPDIITSKMEEVAEATDEQVGPAWFELRKLVTKGQYADVLSALGATADYATQGRRKKFLEKLNGELWPAVVSFHRQLIAWQEGWTAGMNNPGMMMAMMMGNTAGRPVMPPGMMAPPDTSGLRSAAEDVVNIINRVFAGFGNVVARVLAADAMRLKQVLSDPALPTAVGATNREQMLKLLGINVTSEYVRLEQNVTRYILAIVELDKVSGGNDELGYLTGMIQLGLSIPWDKLPGYSGEIIRGSGALRDGSRRDSRDPMGVGSGRRGL